jgi:hypothetical protein
LPVIGPDEFDEQLEAALVTRPVIEQAKGIIVGVGCATPEEAHAELRNVSQQHDIQLNDLAAALVDTAAGRDLDNPLLRKVIWQEWGQVLPNC